MTSKHSWKWLAPRLTGRDFGKGSSGKSARSRPALAIERLEDRQVLSAASPAAETGPPPPSGDAQVLIGLLQGGLNVTQDQFNLIKVCASGKHIAKASIVVRAGPILSQLDDTLFKVGEDLIQGDLTDKKIMAAQDKMKYLEVQLNEVIISSVDAKTQDAAKPIVDALFADAASLVQGLLGVQGAGDAPSEQVTLNFAKIVFEYKEMQALTIKGELGMYGPIKHGIDLQDFEFKIEKAFQKANEAIMNLSDADASALLRATTAATISPTWCTSVWAMAGCGGMTVSSVTGQAHGRLPCLSLKSAPVYAAMTPGFDVAPDTSIEVIVACAIGLRRYAMCSMPGRTMLSVHWVRPVSSRSSSLRLRACPNSAAGGADSLTAVMRAPRLMPRRPGPP
jgi:type VI protein secretion system component Hcp